MIKIKCPNNNCGVEYNVDRIQLNNVICQDCGCYYHQGFNCDNGYDWVRKLAYSVKSCGK